MPMRAKELREIRAQLGLTQRELAETVGIATNNLAKQERGELGISEPLARLIRIIAGQHETSDSQPSRRATAHESAKGSRARHSQGKGRARTRKNPIRRG